MVSSANHAMIHLRAENANLLSRVSYLEGTNETLQKELAGRREALESLGVEIAASRAMHHVSQQENPTAVSEAGADGRFRGEWSVGTVTNGDMTWQSTSGSLPYCSSIRHSVCCTCFDKYLMHVGWVFSANWSCLRRISIFRSYLKVLIHSVSKFRYLIR